MDIYSPISDHGSSIVLDVIDVAMNCVLFLIGCSPMLALIGFAVTR